MSGEPDLRPTQRLLAILLTVQALLGAAYLRKVAVFNAPDEPSHLYYAAHLAETHRLPTVEWPQKPWTREAIQPPLYYAVAAPLYFLVRAKPLEERVRLLRFQNFLLSIINVVLIFLLGRRVLGDSLGLLAAAFAALLPQYLFITTSITNDTLAALFATEVCLLCLGSSAWELGAASGLGLLTKATLWGPVLGWSVAALLDRTRGGKERLRRVAKPLALAAVFFGWFYARNYFLYGDVIGYRSPSITAYDSPMNWRGLPGWLLKFFESFWGYFAWMASPLPSWVYALLAAATLAGIAGFALWIAEDRSRLSRDLKTMLSIAAATALLAFWHGFLHTSQPQGRFLFPALGPISLIMAAGLSYWWRKLPEALHKPAAAIAVIALIGLHVLSYRAL